MTRLITEDSPLQPHQSHKRHPNPKTRSLDHHFPRPDSAKEGEDKRCNEERGGNCIGEDAGEAAAGVVGGHRAEDEGHHAGDEEKSCGGAYEKGSISLARSILMLRFDIGDIPPKATQRRTPEERAPVTIKIVIRAKGVSSVSCMKRSRRMVRGRSAVREERKGRGISLDEMVMVVLMVRERETQREI